MYNSRKEWYSKKYLEYQDWIDNKLVYIKKSEKSESGTHTIPFFFLGFAVVAARQKKKWIIINFLTLESSVISTKLWLSMGVDKTHILFNP